jgi:hypothetical protein
MAISEPSKSAQYTIYSGRTGNVQAPDWGSKLRVSFARLTFTAAGSTSAAAGDISLIRMPAGKVRVFTDLCRVVCPQGTASSDLDIGWSAYTEEDGEAVLLDGDGFAASLDVGGAAIDAAFSLPAEGVKEINSKSGWDVVCSFDTADSPASGDLVVVVVYAHGN